MSWSVDAHALGCANACIAISANSEEGGYWNFTLRSKKTSL